MPADELDPKLAAATRLYVYGREQELRRVFLPTARRWLSGWRRRWEEVVAEAEAAEKNSSLIDEILHDKTLQRREEKIPSSPQEWLLIQAIRQDKTLVRRPEEEQQQLDDKIRELIVLKEKSDEELARFARKPQELEDQKQNTLDGMLRKLYASQKPVEQYFRPHARLLADEQVRQRVSRRVANEIRPIMDELFVVFEIPERAETWTAEFERRLVSELQRIADEEIVRAASSGRPTAHQNAVDQRTQQIGDRAVSSQSPQSGSLGAPVQGEELWHTQAREKSAVEQHRSDVICEAARMGLEGPDYCKHLDREGISPSLRLRKKGCPHTYTVAYRIPKWQKSIQDEKTRIVNESTRKSTSKPTTLQ